MKNEFESLIDIVLSKGVKHSEIISLIQKEILREFASRYQGAPSNVKIIVNERNGNVSIISDKIDITPSDFIPIAKNIALQVLIQKLEEIENNNYESNKSSSSGGFIKWIINFIFWVYNGLYILFISLSLINVLFNVEYREDIFEMLKEFGISKGIIFGILLAVPIISVGMARKAKQSTSNLRLSKIMFLFEMPLVVILFTTLYFENLTLAMHFFLLMIVFTIIAVFLESIKITTDSLWKKRLILILQQVSLMTVGYLVLLYSFFVPIWIAEVLSSGSGIHIILELAILGIVTPLIIIPFLITLFLFKMFLRTYNSFANQIGTKQLLNKHIALVLLVWFVSLCIVSYQPNANFIEKLENLKNTQSFEEREKIALDLMRNKSNIDRELKNISNAQKYYFVAKNDDYLKTAYKNSLKFSDEMADFIQDLFTGIAYPFVYQGTFDRNELAVNNYEYLFGHRLGSYESLKSKSYYGYVQLASRNTRIETDYQGLLATISIEEEYKNTVWRNQEVVYEFSLPVNSAVIDLKLGPNLEFDGVIAPRGAAGKVYQQELNRRRDPALLEQTGPRQYRLRIFPIPGKNDVTTLGGRNQKVKFSYVTELTPQGYPLPVYTKEKNIIINEETKKRYYLNGENVDHYVDNNFVKKISGLRDAPNKCGLFSPMTARISQDDNVLARLVPYNAINEITNIYECNERTGINIANSLKRAKFAILYDVSHDNKDSSFYDDFKKLLSTEKSLIQNNTIDLYLFNDILSKNIRINSDWIKNPKDITYFGEGNWVNQISKIGDQYDFIVIAAADTDVSDKDENLPHIKRHKTPLYIIHNNNKIPSYSRKSSNYILQSGGKVVSSLQDALTNYELSKRLSSESYSNYIAFGPWSAISVSVSNRQYANASDALNSFNLKTQGNNPLSYLANKAYVYYVVSSYEGDLENEIKLLDNFHNFARKAHIVTPFSSLIALVNKRQMADLERASRSGDRYSYEMSIDNIVNISNPINIGWGWGYRSSPESVNAVEHLFSNVIWWFVFLNAVIIAIGGLIYLITGFLRKNKKRK